jgi:tol-pal system protein YbgF
MQNFRPVFFRQRAAVFLVLSGLTAGLIFMPAAPARAQNTDLQTLIERLDRMHDDLRVLQKDYYRGTKTGASRPRPDRPAGRKSAGRLADGEIRMSNLEADMRRLTGQLEEVRHDMRTMLQRLDSLVNDVDFRLTEIERHISQSPAPGAGGADNQPANSAAGQQTADNGGTPPSALPQGTPIERYNHAYSLLTKMRLEDAETAFKEFLTRHGDDELAGNAQYWLGETYYARQNLAEAARAFLVGIQRYPNSKKAPDTMLKLGIALGKLGKVEDACAAFLEMQSKFTKLRTQVRKRMLKEIQAAGCS